jgi:hypothetical protein
MPKDKGITWRKENAKKFLYKIYSHDMLRQNKIK